MDALSLTSSAQSKFLPSSVSASFCFAASVRISFIDYLTINGIIHKISHPHTHQQNGVAEMKRRHIVENGLILLARALMSFKY